MVVWGGSGEVRAYVLAGYNEDWDGLGGGPEPATAASATTTIA